MGSVSNENFINPKIAHQKDSQEDSKMCIEVIVYHQIQYNFLPQSLILTKYYWVPGPDIKCF